MSQTKNLIEQIKEVDFSRMPKKEQDKFWKHFLQLEKLVLRLEKEHTDMGWRLNPESMGR